jgi:UDP-N-acetylglucosamine 2-epimerase (non-hydrolysing)
VTGNPVVDSVRWALEHAEPSPALCALLEWVRGMKLLVLTTHRRESFGAVMRERLSVLRRFVDRHAELALVFPVHPNPEVRACAEGELEGSPRIHLIDPLDYLDFVHLLSKAWLIVSDSGGVQEEAPSLGKPVLVIRDNTERPEAVEAGVARLVGRSAAALEAMLEECYADDRWLKRVKSMQNPFGSGDSGQRIADALRGFLGLGPG